jgi:hypothetical protein
MALAQSNFSTTYISQPSLASVKITWESIQLSSLISKFVVLSEPFRLPTYVKQDVTADTWDGMLSSFRWRVSLLYKEWRQFLRGSLDSNEDAFFEAICLETASEDQFRDSLYLLSLFLARRFGKKVIVLIDEYDAPINFAHELAHEKDFFVKVRPSYPS